MHLDPLLSSFTFQEAARLRDLLQMQSFDAEAGVLSANNEFYAAFRQLQPACFADVDSLWMSLLMFALSSSKIFGPLGNYFSFIIYTDAFFGLFFLLFNPTLSTSVSAHSCSFFSEHGQGWQCGADDEDLASESQDLLRSPWKATTEWLLGWEPCCSHRRWCIMKKALIWYYHGYYLFIYAISLYYMLWNLLYLMLYNNLINKYVFLYDTCINDIKWHYMYFMML